MSLRDTELLLLNICNISIKAGKKILEYYENNNAVFIKEDNSPLTNADLSSNKIIIEELKKIDIDTPILSEETLISWNERKDWNTYWLIDPLDGTKEFIKKNDEFTVNIALIKNNIPILGVIFVPALSIIYYASENFGSYKIHCSDTLHSLDESKKILTNKKKINDHLLVIGSRSHANKDFDKWVKENILDYEFIKKGSSLKFCHIADGNADLYPRFGLTSEWDIAAGHIILVEAGGIINSIDNQEIVYNKKEEILNPYFIASGLDINE